MTDAQARSRLERMTSSASDPKLSVADLDELVALAKRPDPGGRAPGDPGWAPTFDLNAAAAEGWRWKAGRVAGTTSARSIDGDRGEDSFKYLNCIRQAEHYARRAMRSVRVVGVGG